MNTYDDFLVKFVKILKAYKCNIKYNDYLSNLKKFSKVSLSLKS